jgi:aspartate kinase
VTGALAHEFERELARRDIERIWALDEVVVVTVVGAALQKTPGVAGRVLSSVGEGGINVIAIAMGSSECSISLVVNAASSREALRRIHRLLEAEA